MSGWSTACSILWSDCECEGVPRERVGRAEGEVSEGEVVTDGTCHESRGLSLVSDIVDEERVSDVILHSSHIQREWCFPGHLHMRIIFTNTQIRHCFWRTCEIRPPIELKISI